MSELIQTDRHDLFPIESPADGKATGNWFVLHTRSRQEKSVATDLMARRIRHFLPLVNHVRYYGRRKARVDLPLFPGYVFLFGSREEAFSLDRSGKLANILPVREQGQLDWELRNLRLAIEHQAPLNPYPYLEKGIRVEVKSGPFRGLQGLITDRTEDDRLVIQVDMLGQATAIEIDGALLEPLD